MAKKQSRRSISMSRAKYDALAAAAKERGVSMSSIVERSVDKFLGPAKPWPVHGSESPGNPANVNAELDAHNSAVREP